jgi:hypothetical protein
MTYLYKNDDVFIIERHLGQTWYYCEVLKATIKRYAISDAPDYTKLNRIVKRIDIYMESSRYIGALGVPIMVTTTYASDIYQVRGALLNIDRKIMSSEQVQAFYRSQIEKLDKASENYKSLLRIA